MHRESGFVMEVNNETEENELSCKDKVHQVLHNKKFHAVLLGLLVVDAVIVFFLLLVDLEVIPVPGNTDDEKQNNKHTIETGLHYTGFTVLCVFVIEITAHIIVDGKQFFKEIINIFDAVVVFLSFVLDIALTFAPVSNAVRDIVILMVLLRLWRFLKLICAVNVCVRKNVMEEIEEERRKRELAERERDQYKKMLEDLQNNA